MTISLISHETPGASTTDDPFARPVAALARALLAEHARLGAWVAALKPSDRPTWEAAGPTLAELSAVGRDTAREIAGIRGLSLTVGRALTEADAVPSVVWAREIAVMQRLVYHALRDIAFDVDTRVQCAAALRKALQDTRAVGAGVAAPPSAAE